MLYEKTAFAHRRYTLLGLWVWAIIAFAIESLIGTIVWLGHVPGHYSPYPWQDALLPIGIILTFDGIVSLGWRQGTIFHACCWLRESRLPMARELDEAAATIFQALKQGFQPHGDFIRAKEEQIRIMRSRQAEAG